MVYTFDQIEARDPSNPGMVAANAVVTIHAPGVPVQLRLARRLTHNPVSQTL